MKSNGLITKFGTEHKVSQDRVIKIQTYSTWLFITVLKPKLILRHFSIVARFMQIKRTRSKYPIHNLSYVINPAFVVWDEFNYSSQNYSLKCQL